MFFFDTPKDKFFLWRTAERSIESPFMSDDSDRMERHFGDSAPAFYSVRWSPVIDR